MNADKLQALRERIRSLNPEQQQLLRQQLETQGIAWASIVSEDVSTSKHGEAGRVNQDRLPLSASQQHFWVLQQLFPSTPAYHIAFAWHFKGPLDIACLQQTLNTIVQRHAPLRSCFPVDQGEPYQQVQACLPVQLEQRSVTQENLNQEQSQAANQPFDLQTGPLFRFRLLTLGNDEHRLVLVLHHIIADGWSRGVLMREFLDSYHKQIAGQSLPLPALTSTYADHLLTQQQWLQSEASQQQARFWSQQLTGLEPLELPTDYPRTAAVDMRAATYQCQLPQTLLDDLQSLSRSLGASVFMVALAVFKLLLYRYTGQRDISVGIPSAGRDSEAQGQLIGFFVNTLCLRTVLQDDPLFTEWLQSVKATLVDAMEHQTLPFAKVVDAVGVNRSANQNPLFQTLFQLQAQNYGLQNSESPDIRVPGLSLEQSLVELADTKFELSWHMAVREQGLSVAIEYRKALFCEERIAAMVGHFATLLKAVVAQPEQRISQLSVLSVDEYRRCLLREIDTVSDDGAAITLPAASVMASFETIASQYAAETALVCADQSMTYQVLNEQVNRLAHWIKSQLSFSQTETPRVAFCMQRSVDMVVTLLAILKAGAAYVPLDPTHPSERLRLIIEDAEPGLLLVDDTCADLAATCPVVTIKSLSDALQQQTVTNPDQPTDQSSLAYIMFTSGSTGRPKGVPITHANLFNLLQSMAHTPGLKAADNFLAVTTVAFDIATLELILPLVVGAQLTVAERATTLDPLRLAQLISAQQISHMQATPATWRMLIESGWQGNKNLTVLCGGEALDLPLAESLLQGCRQLWNMYGPTETTIWSAVQQVTHQHIAHQQISIGQPIDNTSLLILDDDLQPVPEGIPGELYIGGDGLSPGYWRQPALTQQRFIQPHFAIDRQLIKQQLPGRIYRTGDRVCRQYNGELAYLGRTDYQIKLRGHRIELGEIETVINAYAGIQVSAVVVTGEGNDRQLVAYLTLGSDIDDRATFIEALRHHLSVKLPRYMQPAQLLVLQHFPLNSNGKIDRRELSQRVIEAVDRVAEHKPLIAPRNALESELLTIWQGVLQQDVISVEDNFFDVGGDSIAAMRIVARAREAGIEIEAIELFDHQTIAAQASIARRLEKTVEISSVVDKESVKRIEEKTVGKVAGNSQKQMNQLMAKLNKRKG